MLKVAIMLCEVSMLSSRSLGCWGVIGQRYCWPSARTVLLQQQPCVPDLNIACGCPCAGVGTRLACLVSSNYSYPPCTLTDEETRTEMINRELQISQREKQEILAFEGHLAAASTKQTITESSSLLLSQLTSLDPQ